MTRGPPGLRRIEPALAALRGRLWRLRSLRLRAVLVVVGVVVLPQAIVAAATELERRASRGIESDVVEAASVAARAAQGSPLERGRLDLVARRFGVRLRVYDGAGAAMADFDHDPAPHPIERLGSLLLGDETPDLEAYETSLGPPPARPESLADAVKRRGCRSPVGAGLDVCYAVERGAGVLVYAERSSRLAVLARYDLRYQLAKTTVVMTPVALLIGLWLGRRMVRPVEVLRRQIVERAEGTRASIEIGRRDEFGDLADAFNSLLSALDDRRRSDEAFVAQLVHEFKNPVAAVRAAAEALSGGGADPARAARLSRALHESSRRLDALVTQLLEISRAEAGLPNETRAAVDVASLARGLVAALADDERYRHVSFRLDAPERALVDGVEHRLDAVLRNLLENGASFTRQGGSVAVNVAVTGPEVSVVVSDEGPGILAEHLPHVFDRFFTTRGRERGTGLGLALARAVVEAHGGAIEVSSAPERGATFRVTLPAAPR